MTIVKKIQLSNREPTTRYSARLEKTYRQIFTRGIYVLEETFKHYALRRAEVESESVCQFLSGQSTTASREAWRSSEGTEIRPRVVSLYEQCPQNADIWLSLAYRTVPMRTLHKGRGICTSRYCITTYSI